MLELSGGVGTGGEGGAVGSVLVLPFTNEDAAPRMSDSSFGDDGAMTDGDSFLFVLKYPKEIC